LTSSSHGSVFPKKIEVAKRLVLFDIQKVPESQKHAKIGKPVMQSYTK
jgi:hypothetical protein